MTIVGLIVLGAIRDENLSAGNPYRLTNTIDYSGKICGIDSGVKDLGKGYYLPDATGNLLMCRTTINFLQCLLTRTTPINLTDYSCVRERLSYGE